MKTSIDHLPKLKQDELYQVTLVIRKLCDDVEMIILFGSYSRGDWKEESHLEANRKSGHKSDFDILVVTQKKITAYDSNIWSEITTACNELQQSTHTRIITHDIEYLNIQLAEGQYFFSDIKKEGCLLYNSDRFELAVERDLLPEERRRIAQDYFDHWFERAKRFYRYFSVGIEEDDYKGAAFQLHQATESSYKTILLVFTGYNPNEHYLSLLGTMASDENEEFDNIFPKNTKLEQDRFRKLDYAYIGARYDPAFRITKEDLEILSTQVKKLLELTEKNCKEKIESFVK